MKRSHANVEVINSTVHANTFVNGLNQMVRAVFDMLSSFMRFDNYISSHYSLTSFLRSFLARDFACITWEIRDKSCLYNLFSLYLPVEVP